MTPNVIQYDPQKKFFKQHLENITIAKYHPLVTLSNSLDWNHINDVLGSSYCLDNASLPTRLMAGLHYLRFNYELSEEKVLERFIENPYWQYFCGMVFFLKKAPCDRSSLTKWRESMGPEKLEFLLKEILEMAKKKALLKKRA